MCFINETKNNYPEFNDYVYILKYLRFLHQFGFFKIIFMLKIYKILFLVLISTNCFAQQNLIDSIVFKNNKKTKTNFLLDIIISRPKTKLDSLEIQKDLLVLSRLNSISNVNFTVTKNELNNYILEYFITEKLTIIPSLIIAKNVKSGSYRIGVDDYNFSGKNITFGVSYQYNEFNSFGIRYVSPFFFSSKYGLEGFIQSMNSREPIFFSGQTSDYKFTNNSVEFSGIFRYDYKNNFKIGVGSFIETYKYLEGFQNLDFPAKFNKTKYLTKFQYFNENVKYNFYQLNGLKNSFVYQNILTGSDFKNLFLIFTNDLVFYKKFKTNTNWASRFRIGLSSNNFSPFSAFAIDNNLNVRGVGNLVDRGTATIVLNTEIRQTLFEHKWFALQGNAFVDSGTIRSSGENLNSLFENKNIRIYPGLGLRLIHKNIFNAVFRIDYGFGITKNSSKGIVFGIGQYF